MNTNNNSFSIHVPQVLYENRYCNQEGFSILVCGGEDKNRNCLNRVLEVKIPSFEVTEVSSMVKPHYNLYLVTNYADLFAIGANTELNESLEKSITSVEIYSDQKKTRQHQYLQIEERYEYCICSFMKKLDVIVV